MNLFSRKQSKIFCISMQRTGTSSVGEFFRHFGYKVSGAQDSRKNRWSYYWDNGDFESIFSSPEFRDTEVFEDDPWWLPEFYKVLYHRFPGSRFILFTRDSQKWFESMLNHSGRMNPGNSMRHAKAYRREKEFYELVKGEDLDRYNELVRDRLLPLEGMKEHYKSIYELRNFEVTRFFKKHDPGALFTERLENPDKWKNLAEFFSLDIPEGFEVHRNKSSV